MGYFQMNKKEKNKKIKKKKKKDNQKKRHKGHDKINEVKSKV